MEKSKHEIKQLEPLHYGTCACIYKVEDNAIKMYYDDTLEKDRLKEEVWKILKEINSSHLISIKKLYKSASLIEGYLYPYQEDANVFLLEDKEYFLNNFKGLHALFDIFSSEKIKVSDAKVENVIYTNEHVVLCDPDGFILTNEKDLQLYNYKRFLLLLKTMLFYEIRKLQLQGIEQQINFFLSTLLSEEKKANSFIKKELFSYQSLKDYLMR